MDRELVKLVLAALLAAFVSGMLVGGCIRSRGAAEELALGRQCIEQMEELSRLGRSLAGCVLEVRALLPSPAGRGRGCAEREGEHHERLLLESRVVQAGDERGVQGVPEGRGGR